MACWGPALSVGDVALVDPLKSHPDLIWSLCQIWLLCHTMAECWEPQKLGSDGTRHTCVNYAGMFNRTEMYFTGYSLATTTIRLRFDIERQCNRSRTTVKQPSTQSVIAIVSTAVLCNVVALGKTVWTKVGILKKWERCGTAP